MSCQEYRNVSLDSISYDILKFPVDQIMIICIAIMVLVIYFCTKQKKGLLGWILDHKVEGFPCLLRKLSVTLTALQTAVKNGVRNTQTVR